MNPYKESGKKFRERSRNCKSLETLETLKVFLTISKDFEKYQKLKAYHLYFSVYEVSLFFYSKI